jgi:hypothetical protein
VLPHWAKPTLQLEPHLPASQVAVPLAGASQTFWQSPQLVGLCWMSTQLAPHFAKPSEHSKSQLESRHSALPWFGLGHALPQSPQWLVLVERSKHAPPQLLRAASQLA